MDYLQINMGLDLLKSAISTDNESISGRFLKIT